MSLLYNLYIQWYNKPSNIWRKWYKKTQPFEDDYWVHKHGTFKYITHLHRRARLEICRPERRGPLNTLDLRGRNKTKQKKTTKKNRQNENNAEMYSEILKTFTIYRYVACRAVTMVIRMGGGVRLTLQERGGSESPAVPSVVHAVEIEGTWGGLKCL